MAAINVLLNASNVCKVSDFGLCSQGDDQQLYTTQQGAKVPVRWMAIESLKEREYSMKTDVWAYGVLLFELFSLGEIPYKELDNSEIFQHIDAGNRMSNPSHATEEV